jgi:hypothetical protein
MPAVPPRHLQQRARRRALVLIDHGETTAALTYDVRKHVLGFSSGQIREDNFS